LLIANISLTLRLIYLRHKYLIAENALEPSYKHLITRCVKSELISTSASLMARLSCKEKTDEKCYGQGAEEDIWAYKEGSKWMKEKIT
jgi:hypothetical protein